MSGTYTSLLYQRACLDRSERWSHHRSPCSTSSLPPLSYSLWLSLKPSSRMQRCIRMHHKPSPGGHVRLSDRFAIIPDWTTRYLLDFGYPSHSPTMDFCRTTLPRTDHPDTFGAPEESMFTAYIYALPAFGLLLSMRTFTRLCFYSS